LGLVDVRQLWPGVLDRVKQMRRYAWILLSQNAHVKAVDSSVITIGMTNSGARDSFLRSGADEILHQALIDELGVDWRVEAIIDIATSQPTSRPAYDGEPTPPVAVPTQTDHASVPQSAAAGIEAAKGAIRPTKAGAGRGGGRDGAADHERSEGAAEVDDDDDVIDDAALTSHELLSRELGAEVIQDIRHDAG
ncbi:MAG: polymerase subunit gamma/tau, partial [Nocardioidaceae bacterium]|nr:polymerase subunit gamma/tau [Nocardioidaceae bacterium]